MAKMKTYAVEIVVPIKRTLFVQARRPTGAVDKALTPEGIRESMQYSDDPMMEELLYGGALKNAEITNLREV